MTKITFHIHFTEEDGRTIPLFFTNGFFIRQPKDLRKLSTQEAMVLSIKLYNTLLDYLETK